MSLNNADLATLPAISSSRDFHIGDILTITTGRLVSNRHIEGVYDILNFMTGNSLFTHELPSASRTCLPYLLEQHPRLKEITEEFMDASAITKENLNTWLTVMEETFGKTLPVNSVAHLLTPLADPLTTLDQVLNSGPKKDRKVMVIEAGK